MYDYKDILFDIDSDGIATVKFNHPETANAFTWPMKDEIIDAFEKCSEDERVRVVVLTGEGKHFSAGGNMNMFKENIETGRGIGLFGISQGSKLTETIRKCDKPVIAMVNGAAVGAGCAMPLAADFRVMTRKSRLQSGFVRMGIPGDCSAWYFMCNLIGMAKTREFFMLGTAIRGEEAFELGLCNRLAEEGELEKTTMELAKELASLPTMAISYMKKMENLILYPQIPVLLQLERSYNKMCGFSEDHKEAVYAFLEKRQPVFKGK